MPVKVNSQLPAVKILEADNIFVMDEARAAQQDIRTLKILVVNLMPRKMVTETQLLALLSNTPLQINVDFLHMMTHKSKNITQNHLLPVNGMTPGMIWFQIFLWLPGTNSWLVSDLVAWHLLH